MHARRQHASGSFVREEPSMLIVMMGVSGSGKSVLGSKLAAMLAWDFLEGDDLHPSTNIERMRAGIALEDDDRWPWLDRIAHWMERQSERGRDGVVACSALKRIYRDRLRGVRGDLRLVYLRVPREQLEQRIVQRLHFMPASLLDSQLRILQEPAADENALTLTCVASIDECVSEIRHWVGR
jgi:carbohydrate kinase (thermoresistant glucokinase family)